MKKAVTFEEALKAKDKAKPASRFVETGEGLEVTRAGSDKPEAGKPRRISIADILLDDMEAEEDAAKE